MSDGDKGLCMPSFCHGSHGFHHSVDSALTVLAKLGVPETRITLRMSGAVGQPLQITGQQPPPGSFLGGDSEITLWVCGLGYWHQLPVAMWDSGGERELGTKEILDVVDDPLQKAHHWIREGARLFSLSPENTGACARWIRLFGVDAEVWPGDSLFPLATLLPSLSRVAGTEKGIALALKLMCGLPLREICTRPCYRGLDPGDRSLLGSGSGKLGIDCILSDRVEDLGQMVFVLGPVTLDTYYQFQRADGERLLRMTLALLAPVTHEYDVSWLVGDSSLAPRLGLSENNAVLGINSYLGWQGGHVQPHLRPAA